MDDNGSVSWVYFWLLGGVSWLSLVVSLGSILDVSGSIATVSFLSIFVSYGCLLGVAGVSLMCL